MTYANDPPDSQLFLQFLGPLTDNLIILNFRKTSPPIWSSSRIQIHLLLRRSPR